MAVRLRKYQRKYHFSLGGSTAETGAFIIKAFTLRGLFVKTFAKIFDLSKQYGKNAVITRSEKI